MTGDDMTVTLSDGRLRLKYDGSGFSSVGKWIEPDDDYTSFPLFISTPIENTAGTDCYTPLAFPVPAPVVLFQMRLLWILTILTVCMVMPMNSFRARTRKRVVWRCKGGSSGVLHVGG